MVGSNQIKVKMGIREWKTAIGNFAGYFVDYTSSITAKSSLTKDWECISPDLEGITDYEFDFVWEDKPAVENRSGIISFNDDGDHWRYYDKIDKLYKTKGYIELIYTKANPKGVKLWIPYAMFYLTPLIEIEIGSDFYYFEPKPSGSSLVGAFSGCENLRSITVHSPIWIRTPDDYTFFKVKTGGTLYYPEGSDYSSWFNYPDNKLYDLAYYNWKGVEISVEPEYKPSVVAGYNVKEFDGNAVSSYVDITYTDIETIKIPEIIVGGEWFTLTTTTVNNSETIRYFYNISENTDEDRLARVYFSGIGKDGNTYSTVLEITQNKKEQQTMASVTIDGRYFNLEDGTLYFDSTGGTKTLIARVNGYTAPYHFKVSVNDDNYSVHNVKSELDYDDGEGYLHWIFDFESEGNPTEQSLRGTIEIEYTDGTGSYLTTIPFYVYRTGEGWMKLSQVTDFEYDKNGDNINSIKRTYVGVRYFNIDEINEPICSTWIHLDNPTVNTATVDGSVIYNYPVTVSANIGEKRTGTVIFSGSDMNGKSVSVTQLFKQEAYMVEPEQPEPEPEPPTDSDEVTYSPIWKDVYYTFASDTTYSIYEEVQVYINQGIGTITQEKLIYSGKVYAPPTKNTANVMINKVCQNYFNDNLIPEDGYVGQSHNFKKFILRGDYGQKLHTYYFVNDWSYEPLTVGLKTNPIIPCIVDGQCLFFSTFSDDTKRSYKWGMKYYDGTADYDNTLYVKNDFYTEFVLQSRYKGVKEFYFGDRHYNVIPKCKAQYVLYYINPNGGWDWFPIMGKVAKADTITQYTYTNNYDNNTRQFGKYRYLSEVTTRYTLNTGFLTEKQSDRMWELLESNCVYLHNVVDDKITPVIITNNEIEYKKKERGKKMLTYSINVESSQTRERI